jgi:tight adherence protein B
MALLLGAMVLTGLPAVPGLAQSDEPQVVIVEVDTSRYDEDGLTTIVAEIRNVEDVDLSQIVVAEEGVVFDPGTVTVASIGETNVEVGVVLAIDVSGSMVGAPMEAAKAAAINFVNNKRPADSIALVTFGDSVAVRVPFTTNARSVTSVIAGLEPIGATAFYDGMMASVRLYDDSTLQPHIIALTDGTDQGSAATLEQVKQAVVAGGVRVFGIALEGTDFNGGPVEEIALASPGGRYQATSDAAQLNALYTDIRRELNNKVVITINGRQNDPLDTRFLVRYGPANDTAAVAVPGYLTPEDRIVTATTIPAEPTIAEGVLIESGAPAPLGTLKLVAIVASFFGVVALIWILVGPRGDEQQQRMRERMRQFERGGSRTEGSESWLARIPGLRRLSASAESAADKRGVLHGLESALAQANIALRPGEAIAASLLLSGVVGLLVALFTRRIVLGGIVAAVMILFVLAVLSYLSGRERRRFESQLPDTLTLLSTSLRAGYSLLQAVEAVASEAPDPTAREFGRAVAEIRLGRQVVGGLEGVADRTGSEDFTWAVMAIEIQREVGGNLSEVLQTVADTMMQRNRLRGEVKALTAEGRISAMVLSGLPFALFGFLYLSNPDYLTPLVSQLTGWIALGVGGVLIAAGIFWMAKIVDIEV